MSNRLIERIKNRGRQDPGCLEYEATDVARATFFISASEALGFFAMRDVVAGVSASVTAAGSFASILLINQAGDEIRDEIAHPEPSPDEPLHYTREDIIDTAGRVMGAGMVASLPQILPNVINWAVIHDKQSHELPLYINAGLVALGTAGLLWRERILPSNQGIVGATELTEEPVSDTIDGLNSTD